MAFPRSVFNVSILDYVVLLKKKNFLFSHLYLNVIDVASYKFFKELINLNPLSIY